MSEVKGKVLFNAVLTTINKQTHHGKIELAQKSQKAYTYQDIVLTGSLVDSVKPGDTVEINPRVFAQGVPILTLGDSEYALISERDILYVYDKSEVPKVELVQV